MTIQELDNKILLRNNELHDDKKQEAYEFIKKFMEEYGTDSIVDFVYLDIWEFLKCSIYINCKENDITKISDALNKSKDFFDNIKTQSIRTLLLLMNELLKVGKIQDLIDYFKVNGLINEMKHINSLKGVNGSSFLKLGILKKKVENDNIDLLPFFELLQVSGEDLLKEMGFYIVHRDILDSLRNKVFQVYADPNNKREIEEKKKQVLTKELDGSFNIGNILNKMNKLRIFKEEYERVEKNNQRERIGLSNARLSLGKELDKKYIVNYRDIIKGIKNPKYKYLFLKYIKDHNDEYYEELNEEYEKLKQDSKVEIRALLNDYGISKDSYDFDSLPSYNKEDLETILKVISALDISNEDKIYIIKTTSLEKITALKSYLERDILSVEYVSNNIGILDENSKELDYLKDNIGLIKDYNIPLSIFSESIDVLMNDNSVIKNNIEILDTYDLLSSLTSTNDFNFLLCDSLEKKIDKLLEFGFEGYLESDLNLLNKKNLERLEVLKNIGVSINTREELELYLSDDRDFIVSLDNIDEYIVDESKYVKEPENTISVDDLDKYINKRVYDFNGVLISVQKVRRLHSSGNSLYQSIIDNTHLSEDELLTIKNIINCKSKRLSLD